MINTHLTCTKTALCGSDERCTRSTTANAAETRILNKTRVIIIAHTEMKKKLTLATNPRRAYT